MTLSIETMGFMSVYLTKVTGTYLAFRWCGEGEGEMGCNDFLPPEIGECQNFFHRIFGGGGIFIHFQMGASGERGTSDDSFEFFIRNSSIF